MEKILHHAEDRGRGDHGWLTTRYSFSFADWYQPSRMGFGALRVLNDDQIAAGAGFPPHGHKDMEIITIVTKGAVAHKDSTGTDGIVRAGEVQVMSAGTGVVHSEFNASQSEPLELFQIWITPNGRGSAPRYDQKSFGAPKPGKVLQLVGPMDAGDALGIRQNAYISRACVDPAYPIDYALHEAGQGVYLFCIDGTLEAGGVQMNARDALGISETDSVSLTSRTNADILLIEIPMTVGD